MASSDRELVSVTRDALRVLGVMPEDSVLIAVSGGIDSMSLLDVVVRLRDASEIRSVFAVHVNHLLRAEASESDERLVRAQCREYNVSLEVKREDAAFYARDRKTGLEEAARDCRYHAFEAYAAALGVRWVLTAHTANDQAETILMNIVRGAGLRGIAGIPAKRSIGEAVVARPWLAVTREEIEQYQAKSNVRYALDATNAELKFQRNRVRHIVMPALQQAFPDRDVLRAFSALGMRAAEMSVTIRAIAEERLQRAETGNSLDLRILRSLPGELASEVIELWIGKKIGRYRFSSDERQRVGELVASDIGKLQLSQLLLVCSGGRLAVAEEVPHFEPTELRMGGRIAIPQGELCVRSAENVHVDANHLYVSADNIHKLRLRPWRPEDRITPFGMAGHRKLISDLLTDAGVTGSGRKNYPIVEQLDSGEILWVPGVRGSELTRLKPGTGASEFVELVWSPNREH